MNTSDWTKPMFLRTVGAYRASTFSHGLAVDRGSIPSETFGHLAKYSCDKCGPISEPDVVCVSKESWGFWGGQPAEYEAVCPNCGGSECGDVDSHELHMKVTKRYSIHRNPNYRKSA